MSTYWVSEYLSIKLNFTTTFITGASTEENTEPDSISSFRILCNEFETAIANYKKPCVLVLDGIDEFGPSSGLDAEQVWLIYLNCDFSVWNRRNNFRIPYALPYHDPNTNPNP